jgi:hypothetical protein
MGVGGVTESERIEKEAEIHALGESLGEQRPAWLTALGEADWEAERVMLAASEGIQVA